MIGFGDYTVVSMIMSAGDYNAVSIGRYAHPDPSTHSSATSLANKQINKHNKQMQKVQERQQTNAYQNPSHQFAPSQGQMIHVQVLFGADVNREMG